MSGVMIFCSVITAVTWIVWLVCRLTVGGMCERPELAENFVKADYLTRWYQMYQSKTVPFGVGSKCVTATYSLYDDETNIRVNNQVYDIASGSFGRNWKGGVPDGEPTRLFTAHCSEWTRGHCQAKPNFFRPYSDYNIVGIDFTDANGYSIVYGCETFLAGAIKLDFVWVLTKTAL